MVLAMNIGPRTVLAPLARAGLVLALIGPIAAPATAQVSQRESTAKPAFETPRLLIPVPEIDFGDVIRGERLDATFELRNVGAQTLKVLRADPG